MVMGLLDAQRPTVEAMLKAFQDIEAGKEKEQILKAFLRMLLKASQNKFEKNK